MNLPWWFPIGSAPEITADELHDWLEDGKPLQLIDARSHMEYARGTVKNARFAPVTGLPDSINQLKIDKQIPVIVLCLTGHRSLPGTRLLRSRGFEAYSLKGGITQWEKANYPLNLPSESN